MGRVRVFYGHEGVVPPTGLRSRSAAAPAPEVEDAEVDVIETIPGTEDAAPVEIVGEPVEDGEVISPAEIVNVDGSPAPVDEDGVPVLEPIADEADAPVAAPGDAETLQALPDDSWSGPELDEYAEQNGIDLTGAKKTKATKLARILESTKEA